MKNQYLKLILAGVVAAFVCTSANAQTVDIWGEGQMQGRAAQSDALNERNMFCAVKTPTLELFLAKTDKPTGMVVIAPGGGYQILAYPHEGVQIAQWLNSCGISAAVLKYRVPNFPQEALADIQRAIRLARANAQKWNVKPDKIAVLGFSAGANLCARASTNYTKNAYTPLDETDKLSARPDATFLIYPAYCDQMGNERRWNKGTLQTRGKPRRKQRHAARFHYAVARRQKLHQRGYRLFPRGKARGRRREPARLRKRRARLRSGERQRLGQVDNPRGGLAEGERL